MTVTQRGKLTVEDQARWLRATRKYERNGIEFRAFVLGLVEKSSYREVERLTGLSTNTLQRWKREAK